MTQAARSAREAPADVIVLAPLLTPEQVGAYLDVPLGTLANWRYQGRGPTYLRVGRHVRYRAQDVTEWIDHLAHHRPVS